MNERSLNVPIASTLSVVAAIIAVGLIGANFFRPDEHLGFLAMPFLALAVVLRIRSWFCVMSERERDAFLLGRESGKASVRAVP